MIGTDARPTDTKEPGAAPSQECFDQQAHGDAPHGGCSQGQFRADTLMLMRAGGGRFRKLSIPRDAFAEVPGHEPQKINGAYAFGGAKLQIQTVEQFLGIQVDHVVIIDFRASRTSSTRSGASRSTFRRSSAPTSPGVPGAARAASRCASARERTPSTARRPSPTRGYASRAPAPGPGRSAFASGYDDIDRAKAQQAVINGIKGRLTSPLRLPYNFIHGPIIGWDAPKAFVSDMGFFTMPQLILSSVIGGSSTNVLCARVPTPCGAGPLGSIEVPQSERQRAVNKLIG